MESITLKTPSFQASAGSMSDNAWSIRGDVKDIFLSRPEEEKWFHDFQPLFVMRAVGVVFFL